MVQKLRLVIRDPRLKLALKTAAFAVAFVFLSRWWALLIATLLFIFPKKNTLKYLPQFIIFAYLIFCFYGTLSSFWLSFVFTPLFAMIMDLQYYRLSREVDEKGILYSALIILLTYGAIKGLVFPVVFPIVIYFVIGRLIKNYLYPEETNSAHIKIFSAVFTLIFSELVWIISFLSIHPVVATLSSLILGTSAIFAAIFHYKDKLITENIALYSSLGALLAIILLIATAFSK